jgi:hypothetical protein
VFVNEGEHYDPYDGVFLAPQKGVYLFSWTVSGTGGTYMVTALVDGWLDIYKATTVLG